MQKEEENTLARVSWYFQPLQYKLFTRNWGDISMTASDAQLPARVRRVAHFHERAAGSVRARTIIIVAMGILREESTR